MNYTTEKLYQLLPAIYRIRDIEQGEALKMLLTVIAEQVGIVEADIERLYDNWFIETCDEWVVPYIGDLLGVGNLYQVSQNTFSQRARVANTLTYRRRKGTATMLEELARDTTLWNARAVEFFELLSTTQYFNHIRLHNVRTPDLRQVNTLELLDTPFDVIAHTADVRHIVNNRGKHNIPNIGLFLWRLQSYALKNSTPRAIATPPDGRYTFTSLGYNAPLFNQPQTEESITHLAEEINVPDRIRPLAFHLDLKAYQEQSQTTPLANSLYYGPDRSLNIIRDGTPVPPIEVMCMNLSNWGRPAVGKVGIDVRLGRIAFAVGETPTSVSVSYNYGFSGDIGSGPYDRRSLHLQPDDLDTVANPEAFNVLIRVSATGISTINNAIATWNPAIHPKAVIQIDDSRTYQENLTINMPGTNAELIIQAANLARPTLIGNMTVTSGSPEARLSLNGLLIAGSLSLEGQLEQLNIRHCTLVPGRTLNDEGQPQEPNQPSLVVNTPNDNLRLLIDHSIVGALRLPTELVRLGCWDSIIESPAIGVPAVAASAAGDQPGPPTTLERTTVFGAVYVKELTLASEVIFTHPVVAERLQAGCVRFSYVPDGSHTPNRYRCQPDLEISTQIEAAQKQAEAKNTTITQSEKDAIRVNILGWLIPAFTSTRYGQAAYGQLSLTCPLQIRTGAEDGSEMGAFSYLKQPQREANLQTSLNEYLRFGLEAGIFYVT